jgi:hypothetical protein
MILPHKQLVTGGIHLVRFLNLSFGKPKGFADDCFGAPFCRASEARSASCKPEGVCQLHVLMKLTPRFWSYLFPKKVG